VGAGSWTVGHRGASYQFRADGFQDRNPGEAGNAANGRSGDSSFSACERAATPVSAVVLSATVQAPDAGEGAGPEDRFRNGACPTSAQLYEPRELSAASETSRDWSCLTCVR